MVWAGLRPDSSETAGQSPRPSRPIYGGGLGSFGGWAEPNELKEAEETGPTSRSTVRKKTQMTRHQCSDYIGKSFFKILERIRVSF
jgi:hypothetical protein